VSVFCNLCDPPTRHSEQEIAEHMAREHDFDLPAALREASWPDGGAIIIDKTLTPEDFS
jgi:hypothetical protein